MLKDNLKRKNTFSIDLPDNTVDLKPLQRELRTAIAGLEKALDKPDHSAEVPKQVQRMVEENARNNQQLMRFLNTMIDAVSVQPQINLPDISVPAMDSSGVERAIQQGLSGVVLEMPAVEAPDFDLDIHRDSEGRISRVSVVNP